MANRTKRGQKVHDDAVANWAKKLKGPGKTVLADLPGHKRPPKMDGFVPDIAVKQGGKTKLIGEVETPSTINTDKKQQNAFKDAAKRMDAKFVIKVAKEKRSK